MKFNRNKIFKNHLKLYVFFCIFSLIFSSSDLLNRKVNTKNKFRNQNLSKAKVSSNEVSTELKIIDDKTKKDYSLKVIMDMDTFYDKSGLTFKLDQDKLDNNFPFVTSDNKQFFIGFINIKKFGLKKENNELKNILELQLIYNVDSSDQIYTLEFNFKGGIFNMGEKFNREELKTNFLDKLHYNSFKSRNKEILEELNSVVESLRYIESQKIHDAKYLEKIKQSNLETQKDIEKENSRLNSLIEDFKKTLPKGFEYIYEVFDNMEEIINEYNQNKLEFHKAIPLIKEKLSGLSFINSPVFVFYIDQSNYF